MKNKIQETINKIVFFAATLAIAAVFYEGMTLQWYSIVVVFILVMDYSFFLATIVNLIIRKNKFLQNRILFYEISFNFSLRFADLLKK